MSSPRPQTSTQLLCFHCGLPCERDTVTFDDKSFCCSGCRTVYEILNQAKLSQYYTVDQAPGSRPASTTEDRFTYLEDRSVVERLLSYQDEQKAEVTLSLPQMHCAACVWLLEHLYRLDPGIQRSEAQLPTRQVRITFDPKQTSLRKIVCLLARLGYEPDIRLDSLSASIPKPKRSRLYAKIGIAGFAFANIMLFSLPEYFSGGTLGESALSTTFRYASLLLAIPVLLYSAADYFRSAWYGLRARLIPLDVPIALGIGMLFGRSAFDILSGIGPGYLDSFSGLVFFLLVGRLFQQKTFERLSFDNDYRAYFPVACVRKDKEAELTVPLTALRPGDRVLVRNQELVPADAILISGSGNLDYSFVTGESDPQSHQSGDRLYAGGKQCGGTIEIEVLREVSESYLAGLWRRREMQHTPRGTAFRLADLVARYFVAGVLLVAGVTTWYWLKIDPSQWPHAVTSVLIVACPCALALASPFALGAAARFWGRHGLFVREVTVVERLADIDTIVFDKTGTLTSGQEPRVTFVGEPLSDSERNVLAALVSQSTHPISRTIAQFLGTSPARLDRFEEVPGLGLEGELGGCQYRLGSATWVGIERPQESAVGNTAHLSIDGRYRGTFVIEEQLRDQMSTTLKNLHETYQITVLSGDRTEKAELTGQWFDRNTPMQFAATPTDKLEYVKSLQQSGKRALMLGDGLNDAGALRAAEVGIAVTEDSSSFSPACDAIIDAASLHRLDTVLACARSLRRVVIAAFGLSLIYNVVGLGLAAAGLLSPLVSAILMPISSVTVVLTAVLGAHWVCRRKGLT